MEFYTELVRRAVALANCLQYENSARLISYAFLGDDEVPPELLDAQLDMWAAFNVGPEETYDHDLFDNAVTRLENWLKA